MVEENLFEWDEAKSEKNEHERGFGFRFAVRLFAARFVETESRSRDYGERRMKATGKIGEGIYTVVYTWRGERRRIISARLASRRERNGYRQNIAE